MIPIRLYMRNFMCYREQTLDFRGIHLACLTGSNGHGKSAVLDALTWALWGYSRVGARRDDELIHLGQSEMEVEFEFLLSSDGGEQGVPPSAESVTYRVIRKRSKGSHRRSGQSALELQGWDPVEERFRSLSESAITRTQDQITSLLRMDYDTFINSAFLLQGRADEFTVKRPAERKRVLGDILGLGLYDRYEQLAKEAAREKRERADQLCATIEQIDRELEHEEEYQADVASAEAELARLRHNRAQVEERHSQVRTALQEAEAAQGQLTDYQQRVESSQRESERLQAEIERHRERQQALEHALSQADEIEGRFEAYRQAVTRNEALNHKLAELVSLNEQHSQLEGRIAAERHELDKQQHSTAERVEQLSRAAEALEQKDEWETVHKELERLEERETQRGVFLQELQTLTAETASLLAGNKRAEADAAQTKEKIDLLSHTGGQGSIEDRAHCPLCSQPLAETERVRLLDRLKDELEAERDAYRRRSTQVKDNQERMASIKETVSSIDRELLKRAGLQRKEATLAIAVEEGERAQDALPAAQEALQALERQLQEQTYALEERDALREVELQLGELGYDADEHRRIRDELGALRSSEGEMQTLRDARSSVDTVRLAISQLRRSRSEIEKQLNVDRAHVEELNQVVTQLPHLRREASEVRQALEEAHDREQQASLSLGAARNKLEHCADLRQYRVKRVQEERQQREEQAIYQELQGAFGKNGVQALLIESAIPEIEKEANQLLARMTRGTMHILFDTQRDTKKGTTIETLDIYISDQLGTRSYETYSGGERYRIDFAIRMALSKLLTRRAGAQLQMLVIDEGFGTQDSEGRDGLIDAIRAVSEDFACILAVTHIDELKDAFNVHIEVSKTAEGSQIAIN